ncbi:MAG TPA: hypothetical protein DEB73_00015 [Candidatus Magasanikbacteria bacterium]|uniref:Uncharacterized protein n=1 Tax=Candidatus Magasanikbacteria bacterium GW2011_GWC2_41_17 TaxID=1619048 RepID=A0A0G0V8D4_9BACT|nr:MAG: hypothetical protein UU49_C0034G0002 [Candidatus Magasanikbacteria bacterium GW2011_GWC2_41_17]HBV57653.1 hypothetical protein [Candidatus Magasanikbacteria bacterium]HBX15783.1 hypothetical protein [Candidatus Magasanikbacteria bacterium]
MKGKRQDAVSRLLARLLVYKVQWSPDGRLRIGLICGSNVWPAIREIENARFEKWAEGVGKIGLHQLGETTPFWWSVLDVCGAGPEPASDETEQDGWFFSFQVQPPPGGQEQIWKEDLLLVTFQDRNGSQIEIGGGQLLSLCRHEDAAKGNN